MHFVLDFFCRRQPPFGVRLLDIIECLDCISKDAHMTRLGDDHQPSPSVSDGSISSRERSRHRGAVVVCVPLAGVTAVRITDRPPPPPPSRHRCSVQAAVVFRRPPCVVLRRCRRPSSSSRAFFRRLFICVCAYFFLLRYLVR